MKKVMFALCFMFGGIVTLTAQDTQDTTSNEYRTETQSQYPQDALSQQQQGRERIQSTELPDEVKRALEGEEYRGWLVSGAFKSQASTDPSMGMDTTTTDPSRQEGVNATDVEGEEIYIVELKNGAETKEVRFDSNGQKLEDMENQQDSQFNQNNQNNEYNQNNRNDQLNQNEQMDPTRPSDQGLPTDPNTIEEPADPNAIDQPADPNAIDQPSDPNAIDQPSDPSAIDRPDQSGQSQSSDQFQNDPSTGTPSGQSPHSPGTTPDQPRTNEPN